MLTGLTQPIAQEDFAAVVGISQPRVAQLVAEGILLRGSTAGHWLIAYCERLREQAAGRGQELTIERTALARSQRVGQELKNAITQGDFAPVGLLTDVLAAASAAVVSYFDALPSDLRKSCPELTEAHLRHVDSTIAAARNEWVRATATLAVRTIDELTEPDDDTPADPTEADPVPALFDDEVPTP